MLNILNHKKYSGVIGRLNRVLHDVKVLIITSVIGISFTSCGDWIDVVPDGVATIDMAFNSRSQALRYLTTCYSYMPKNGGPSDPTVLGGDDMWARIVADLSGRFNTDPLEISAGRQNATSPILGRWNDLYRGLRICNTFLENIRNLSKAPDLQPWERDMWIAEATVLKAYFHYCLVQMYGPVPLIRENFPVDVDVHSVKVVREPVDDCIAYIVELLDEACEGNKLLMEVGDPAGELGRITKPIALSLKAKVLVMAASPLFNCNEQQATLRNHDGTQLFSQDENQRLEKWRLAMEACKEAIDACAEAGIILYEFENLGDRHTPEMALDVTLRNAFNLAWNSEIIWANTQMISTASLIGGMIAMSMPRLTDQFLANNICKWFGVPLKIAHEFYTCNGVPLEEDNTRDLEELYNLRTATEEDALYIREGRTTVDLHFDREPRFYAWIGFDGGVWFGADRITDENPSTLRYLGFKAGEVDGEGLGSTGYIAKKHVPYRAQLQANNSISSLTYPWPIIRLSDLYLMYAEAINEFEGPNGANSVNLFKYIDLVRERAGLKGVKYAWDTYTNNPKYNNQTGMRAIIHQERLIELCYEGQRFWDIRRWRTAPDYYQIPQEGWDLTASTGDGSEEEVNRIFYTPHLLAELNFRLRDYFWPIRNDEIDVNPNLVQNIGW